MADGLISNDSAHSLIGRDNLPSRHTRTGTHIGRDRPSRPHSFCQSRTTRTATTGGARSRDGQGSRQLNREDLDCLPSRMQASRHERSTKNQHDNGSYCAHALHSTASRRNPICAPACEAPNHYLAVTVRLAWRDYCSARLGEQPGQTLVSACITPLAEPSFAPHPIVNSDCVPQISAQKGTHEARKSNHGGSSPIGQLSNELGRNISARIIER
jgi:hypothetical protein